MYNVSSMGLVMYQLGNVSLLNQYLKKIYILGSQGTFWTLILDDFGLPGFILETHFGRFWVPRGNLEAKSVFKRRLWANRVTYATSSGPKWPQVRRNHPQGCPKGAKKEPQEDPKWNKNRRKTLYKIKNRKTSKMTTLPHEIHIFEGSKGGKIDRKALQIVFWGSSNGCSEPNA